MSVRAVLPLAMAALVACGSNELKDVGNQLELGVDEILFGDVVVGTKVSRTISLTNLGRSAMNIAVLDLPEGFDVEPSSFTLDAGAKLEVEVSLRPLGGRLHQGSIRFDATSGDWGALHVEGRGLTNVLEVPASMDFGLLPVGDIREMRLPVQSQVDQEIEIGLQLVGQEDFGKRDDTVVLRPRELVHVPVSFRPLQTLGRNAQLRISSCGGCESHTVLLFGEGVAKEIAVHPPFLDFGPVAVGVSKSLTFEVRNSGVAPLELSPPLPAGEDFHTDLLEATVLGPQESIAVEATFRPRSRGLHEETLQLHDVHSWELGGIYLRGEGTSALEAQPPQLYFAQPPGVRLTQTVVVRSLDPTREITITGYRLEGPGADAFELEGPPVGSTVGASSRTFTIHYQAVEDVRHQAELVVQTRDSVPPTMRIPLVGEDFSSRCAIRQSHGVLNFGVLPSDDRLRRTLELTNVGSGPCFVWDIGIQPCEECEAEAFRLVEPPEYRVIDAGELFTIEVETAASQVGAVQRTLAYRYASLLEPPSEVELRYTGSDPAARIFQVEPTGPAIFPPTVLGEETVHTLVIRTTAQAFSGLIESIALAEGSSTAFRLAPSNPPMPAVFGEEGIAFEVGFYPYRLGRAYGQVEVQLKGAQFNDMLRFDLIGEAVLDPEIPLSLPEER